MRRHLKCFPSRALPASNKVFIPQERQKASGDRERVTERTGGGRRENRETEEVQEYNGS